MEEWRKSQVHVGTIYLLDEGKTVGYQLVGQGEDNDVKRSWEKFLGKRSWVEIPMISTSGFLGMTHEWRWMKKTHGVEDLLTHLCLSKNMRYTVSNEVHICLQALLHF